MVVVGTDDTRNRLDNKYKSHPRGSLCMYKVTEFEHKFY